MCFVCLFVRLFFCFCFGGVGVVGFLFLRRFRCGRIPGLEMFDILSAVT
jgi:hypothetical protein